MREELNIWTKNYIDVNSLVTEKFMMQKSLDKAKTDLESLTKKYQDLEMRHKKVLNDYNKTKAKKVDAAFDDELADDDGQRWVEGGESNSDHDSGKHSDTSLVNSSEECWAEINKINKSFNKRQTGKNITGSVVHGSEQAGVDKERVKDHLMPGAGDSQHSGQDRNRSKYFSAPDKMRNVTGDSDQRTGGAGGRELTPTTSVSSSAGDTSKLFDGKIFAGDTSTTAGINSRRKLEKEISAGDTEHDVHVVHVTPTHDDDHDTYVDKDTLLEEAVMVESQTIRINESDVSTQASINNNNHRYTKQDSRGRGRDYYSSSYDDVPLPPSPRPVSKYRSREKSSRKEINNNHSTVTGDSNAASTLTDDDSPKEMMKRQPRPPIRRRPRSKMIAERPKSAPPEKYDSSQLFFNSEKTRPSHFSSSRDLSDEETSEMYLSRERCSGDAGESNHGTLESVSAKSFGFIRPSQRLLEREHNKRIKRHKSFFNTDSLFGKKNSLIRRAESFHHGAGPGDYYLMNGKYYSRDPRNRAKSVDRLLTAGDETPDDLDKPLLKSKSMEFLKTKILRKPSKLQKKPSRLSPGSETFLGQSMFELHKSPRDGVGVSSHTGPGSSYQYQAWPRANSSVPASSEFSKQDVRLSRSSSRLETSQHLPLHDWRQDTPFWNHNRHKRKENVINWGLTDPPPSWAPPPPGGPPSHHSRISSTSRKSRESMSPPPPPYHHHQSRPGHVYPGGGAVLHQAVNSMYLPTVTPSQHFTTSLDQDSMEDSVLEITELEDEPLTSSRHRSENIIHHPTARILEMPSGLY